jgi:hypothetical protein
VVAAGHPCDREHARNAAGQRRDFALGTLMASLVGTTAIILVRLPRQRGALHNARGGISLFCRLFLGRRAHRSAIRRC